MVLDLRLTKGWDSAESLFLCPLVAVACNLCLIGVGKRCKKSFCLLLPRFMFHIACALVSMLHVLPEKLCAVVSTCKHRVVSPLFRLFVKPI